MNKENRQLEIRQDNNKYCGNIENRLIDDRKEDYNLAVTYC